MHYMSNEAKVINIEDYDESMDKYYRKVDFIGDIVLLSPPALPSHNRVSFNFGVIIENIVIRHTSGCRIKEEMSIYSDEESKKHNRGVHPDTAILCTKYSDDIPVLVCEILSHSTAKYDINSKKDLYKKVGVLEYWVIDPTEGKVLVCDFVNDIEKVFIIGDICKSFIFKELYFPVENLFTKMAYKLFEDPRVRISVEETFIGDSSYYGSDGGSKKMKLF